MVIVEYKKQNNITMKHLFKLWIAATLLFIAGCSESNDNGDPNDNGGNTPTTPTITLNKSSVSFDELADEESISFSTTADWIAEIVNDRADGWLNVTPQSGSAGDASITIKAKENDTPDERNASVRIKAGSASKTISVSQKQKDALTVTSSKFEVEAEGGEVKIEVKANIDFEYAIDESAKEWIKYEGTRAMKTSTLTFSVAKNDDTDKREGKIAIKSGEFNEVITIYQAGSKPSIVISKNEYVVSSDGGTVAVEVKSNVDVAVELPTDVDWLHENTSRGVSTNTYYFDIAPSDELDQRTAEVVFTNKENGLSEVVKITQMQKDAIVLAESVYEFGVDGGNLDFEIQTNVDVTVTISDDAKDWIQQVETRALETKTLYFNVSACSAEEDREGTLTISGGSATQTIKVTQSGLKEILEKEREALIAFYKATDGDNWRRKDNWCSDKPVSEWYGVSCTNGRVVSLRLFSNKLSGSIPPELGNLSNLRKLDLHSNQLSGSIPSELGNLSNLNELDLCSNQLSSSIPPELGNLSNLNELDLYSNQLSGSIPPELGNLSNLNELDLHSNQLSGSIPPELGNLSNLNNLYLRKNQLSGSIPPELGNLSNLNELLLYSNQLSGSIPPELGNLSNLNELDLHSNQLSGSIPPELGNLSNLSTLDLGTNQLSGSIPPELGNLSNLSTLDLGTNQLIGHIPSELTQLTSLKVMYLANNKLTGSIPSEIVRLTNLTVLSLCWNYLTGELPLGVDKMDIWAKMWPNIIEQYADNGKTLSVEGVTIPAPEFSATTIDGISISDAIYAENEYTILFNFSDTCIYSREFVPILLDIYDAYKDKGVDVICYSNGSNMSEAKILSFRDEYKLPWHCFLCHNSSNATLYAISLIKITSNTSLLGFPQINVVDKEGNIVFNQSTDSRYDLANFLAKKLGAPEIYESSDYSKDGEIKQLQAATKGNGIDIVLMGDAYSDRLIADGTYENAMNVAMEKFFMEEPYKSFRDHFNVYSVTAVSKNEVYTDTSETAFTGYFGGGTQVGGNDTRVFSYAEKAIGAERMDDALIVVMMNSDAYAGTCYMYYPSDGDWGNGVSISYFPTGNDEEALAQILHHEAAGHGFSKLGDEYAYEAMGNVPEWEIESARTMATYGWWKNVDFTNDPAKIKWSHFLSDSRYAGDGLGVYEGAYTYWTGVWRPTENSIMRYNTGGFNAPSREAIYYRIHKLAYGSEWEYDYEKFVEYDAINRKTTATTRGVPYRMDIPEDFKPLHPPVVMNTSWRNAKNNAPAKNTTRSSGGNAVGNLQKSVGAPSHTTAKPMPQVHR